jgi:signal transduction histidine kinase
MGSIFAVSNRPAPWKWVTVCLGLTLGIGLVDYATGYELSFSVFYLAGVCLGAWHVGRRFGLLISVLSVAAWLGGDLAAGAPFSTALVPIWNAVMVLAFYAAFVWLVDRLHSLQRDLERRVAERTAELTREIAGRERLEKELLENSEREQRRIGYDLHDNFCQHLTSTAMAVQVLREKLAAKAAPEVADTSRVMTLVEEGIVMARELARGLAPVELEAEGLMAALQELAASISKWSKVSCVFECESPVLVHDANTAMQLYRIAQESVSNAIRHGRAGHIVINLEKYGAGLALSVEDDGVGLPDDGKAQQGLGTRTMSHRAATIGGTFSLEPNLTGGTLARCQVATLPAL